MYSEDDDEDLDDVFRTPQEIAIRSLILASLISVVYGASARDTEIRLKEFGLWEHLSPKENKFICNPENERLKIDISWRSEALVVLLWSIKILADIQPLTGQSDISQIRKNLTQLTLEKTQAFIKDAELRNDDEIYDSYNKVYDSHWLVRDAQINGKKIPDQLDPGVVREMHHGFNYIIGYCSQPWDEITTDT